MTMTLAETRTQRTLARKKRMRRDKILSVVLPISAIVLLLAVWEIIVVAAQVPAWMVPRPTAVFRSMVADFSGYWPHILRTYTTIIAGWVCACVFGVTLGALISNFKILGLALTPYLNMLCTLPVMTLVPMMLLFLGFGQEVLILAVLLQSFAIVNMNSVTGFNNVENIRLELMQSLRSNRIQTFFRCVLPSSWPNVFTGFKLSAIFATTACISSEFNGGNIGLGAQIIYNKQYMKTDKAFACIFFVAIIGIFLYTLTNYLETKVVKWKE